MFKKIMLPLLLFLSFACAAAPATVDDRCPTCRGFGTVSQRVGKYMKTVECPECKGSRVDPALKLEVKDLGFDLIGKTRAEVGEARLAKDYCRIDGRKYSLGHWFPKDRLADLGISRTIRKDDFEQADVAAEFAALRRGVEAALKAKGEANYTTLDNRRIFAGKLSPQVSWVTDTASVSLWAKTDQHSQATRIGISIRPKDGIK